MSTAPEPQPNPGLREAIFASLTQAAVDSAGDPDPDPDDTTTPDPADASNDQTGDASDEFLHWLAGRLAVDVQTYLDQQR